MGGQPEIVETICTVRALSIIIPIKLSKLLFVKLRCMKEDLQLHTVRNSYITVRTPTNTLKYVIERQIHTLTKLL